MDVLVDVANVIFLLSYSVRDILWLRVLTVLATVVIIPYYYASQAAPMMTPIWWNLGFVGLNVFWIGKIVRERRPVPLTDDERALHDRVFPTLSPWESRGS